MDTNILINIVLTVWLLGSLVFLTAVESYTAVKHIPTISERLQRLSATVPLVRFLAVVVSTALLVHFFAQGL